MKTRICEQRGGKFTPVPVKVKTLIACPHRNRGCGENRVKGDPLTWMPKTYWQLPGDE